jgi:anti-sigma factor RsiW
MREDKFVLEWVMEHENAYTLMMDALDGKLAEDHRNDLEAHLRACPPCMREWQAVLAIDALFRQTPALSPAAGFTQRTLARLPSRKYRIWTISAVYMMLLLAGTLPLLIGFWAVNRLGPVLSEPALVRGVLQSMEKVLQVSGTVLSALLSGAGELVQQQPAIIGWLLVMVGVVFLWGGVYRQILSPQLQRQRQI